MERDPEVGEIVAAKEKNGSKFYRAEVISKMDHEYYNVCFIDFGSWNTVHKSNIVQPKEFQVKIYFIFQRIKKSVPDKKIFMYPNII